MIFISNSTASAVYGTVEIENNPDFTETQVARVTRSKTLDGNAFIFHAGVSAGDHSFNINGRVTKTKADILEYLFKNASRVVVSCTIGCFIGAIESYEDLGGDVKLKVITESYA